MALPSGRHGIQAMTLVICSYRDQSCGPHRRSEFFDSAQGNAAIGAAPAARQKSLIQGADTTSARSAFLRLSASQALQYASIDSSSWP